MDFHDFDTTLNIDYAGYYIDDESDKERPILKLRLYIFKDPNEKVRGLNISSQPSTSLDGAIDHLSKKIDVWFLEKYQLDINSKIMLNENEDLKSKFNRWLGIRPQALRQARTITIKQSI